MRFRLRFYSILSYEHDFLLLRSFTKCLSLFSSFFERIFPGARLGRPHRTSESLKSLNLNLLCTLYPIVDSAGAFERFSGSSFLRERAALRAASRMASEKRLCPPESAHSPLTLVVPANETWRILNFGDDAVLPE